MVDHAHPPNLMRCRQSTTADNGSARLYPAVDLMRWLERAAELAEPLKRLVPLQRCWYASRMLQLLGRPAVCSKCHRDDWCGLVSTTPKDQVGRGVMNSMCPRSCADATAMLPCVALQVMRANFEHLLKSATAAGVFIQASGAPKLGGYGATHTLLSVARAARDRQKDC